MPSCTHCGEYTTSRGPFGEALHSTCWEEQDEGVARVERRLAEKHGYDTDYYARVDAERNPAGTGRAAKERYLEQLERSPP